MRKSTVLQLLEDMGYVMSNLTEGKKVYILLNPGKKYLEEQKRILKKSKDEYRAVWTTVNFVGGQVSIRLFKGNALSFP
jgi:DNA-binding PadR family transcriptional regulator